MDEIETRRRRTEALVEQGVRLLMADPLARSGSTGEVRQRLCGALAAGRAVIVSAREDELELSGLGLWATVSDETDANLRGDLGPRSVSLGGSEWNDGTNVWLLDVVARTSDARDHVMQAFRHVVGDRPFSVHPAAEQALKRSYPDGEDLPSDDGERKAGAATVMRPSRRKTSGPPVRIETERFILASMSEDDGAIIGTWMSDRRITDGLLQLPRLVDEDQGRAFIAKFDDLLAYLIGIRRREDDTLIGYYMVHIDPQHRTASISIVIGDRSSLRQQTGIETARSLVEWLFDVRGVEKIVIEVAETNTVVADWMASRIRLEGRLLGEIRRSDGTRVTLLRYGLLRDEWADVRAASVARQTKRQE